jgi:hypothetical protein
MIREAPAGKERNGGKTHLCFLRDRHFVLILSSFFSFASALGVYVLWKAMRSFVVKLQRGQKFYRKVRR